MKKFKFLSLIILCICLLSSFSMQAQDKGPKNIDPKVRMENQLKRLTKELTLTSDQKEQISKMWADADVKRKELMDLRKNGKDKEIKKQIKDLRDSGQEQMKQILSAEQYTKYLEMQKQEMEKAAQKRQNRGSVE
ncbi:MAG: hypothetical protein ACRC9Q_10170 [Bacteroidales bacterium]